MTQSGYKFSEQEHVDLEEKFQISAEIEFRGVGVTYDGMNTFEVKVRRKREKKIEIVNVDTRKTNDKSRGLF